MKWPAAYRVGEGLQWVCAAIALWMIGCFIFVAASSVNYPFHLEWMEGQSIDIIQRVRSGLPIYVKPSIEYVPFLYTPYFYYLAAFVSLFTGVDFLPGRLVSFAAALGTGMILYKWLRREECSIPAAITGAGAYFATYLISGRWMDVARVDSLFLCLSLTGLYVLYYFRGTANALLAAAILCAAFFTKQTSIILFAPAFAAMLLIDRRHAVLTGVLFLSAAIVLSLLAHLQSDGWFSFYVYQLGSMHRILTEHLKTFWTRDVLPQVGGMLLLAIIVIGYSIVTVPRKGLWYAALALGFIGCSYAGRLKWGGFINVLMPACCILALLTGLSLSIRHHYVSLLAPVLAAAQLGWLIYNPYPYIPTQAAVERGNAFLEQIARFDGEVLMPEIQFVQTRVGKKSYSLNMAAMDIIAAHMGDKKYIKQEFVEELSNAIARQQFAAILTGGVLPLPGLRQYYELADLVPYPREFIFQSRNFLKRELMIPIKEKQAR